MKVAQQTCHSKNIPLSVISEKIRIFLKYAILAPSSYNTQPWSFSIHGASLHIYTDLRYWIKLLDPMQKELFMSIGCLLENIIIAAKFFGYYASVKYLPKATDPELCLIVDFKQGPIHLSKMDVDLFESIESRSTSRTPFLKTPVKTSLLDEIKTCFLEEPYSITFVENKKMKEELVHLAFNADINQFGRKDFQDEFAKILDQGLIDNRYLLRKLKHFIDHFFPKDSETKQRYYYPTFGIIFSEKNTKIDWIKLGQILERIYLKTTTLGLSLRPISRTIEESESYNNFKSLFAENDRIAQIPFLLGYTTITSPSSSRRPLNSFFKSYK
ncbi:MAG: hypothetical protein KAR79_02090 [Simkaniaceae bacterium]|nr:hypothetical protein [Simkaniaceae bacterium]